MTRPVRLRLSRAKGFNLQEHSRSVNGLEAVVVRRPTKWGNPFLVHPDQKPSRIWGAEGFISAPTVGDAIECFREMMTLQGERADGMRKDLHELSGKNLACTCALNTPCHADVLLELANRPICEEVK